MVLCDIAKLEKANGQHMKTVISFVDWANFIDFVQFIEHYNNQVIANSKAKFQVIASEI